MGCKWTASDLAKKTRLPDQQKVQRIASEGKQRELAASGNITVNVKPLSVNCAWKGKRYRSDAYRKYQEDVKRLLPKISIPTAPYKLSLIFGFSNNASDADNGVKCFQDVIAAHYGFNDKLITELHVKKVIVAKGAEFIQFKITTAE